MIRTQPFVVFVNKLRMACGIPRIPHFEKHIAMRRTIRECGEMWKASAFTGPM